MKFIVSLAVLNFAIPLTVAFRWATYELGSTITISIPGTCRFRLGIKNTKGPLERRFMIKASIVTGIALFIFLGLLFALPSPYRFLVWIPYGIFLPLGIGFINKRQRDIQAEEGGILPGDSR
jgi:hypothetical protein